MPTDTQFQTTNNEPSKQKNTLGQSLKSLSPIGKGKLGYISPAALALAEYNKKKEKVISYPMTNKEALELLG